MANPPRSELDRFMWAISQRESGHNYQAMGPSYHPRYGRALGRYQVMSKIMPSWTRAAGLGHMSISQFLNSPRAQDTVARWRMSQLYRQYAGRWDLVATAWFGGEGAANRVRQTGSYSSWGGDGFTSMPTYVRDVMEAFGTSRQMAGGGSGQLMTSLDIVRRAMSGLNGLRISSTYRSESHNARVGGSSTSWHMNRSNPAVDISGPSDQLDVLARRLSGLGLDAELLWRTKGHYDHVHFAVRSSEPVVVDAFGDGIGDAGPGIQFYRSGGDVMSGRQLSPTEYVETYFPSFAWALKHPELGPILREAASDGWDQLRLQGALQGTNWWRTTSATAREHLTLMRNDPSTFRQNLNTRMVEVRDRARQLGVPLANRYHERIARDSMRFGWSPSQMDDSIKAYSNLSDVTVRQMEGGNYGGMLSIMYDRVERIANDYMINLSDDNIMRWTRQLLDGKKSEESFTQYAQTIARRQWPALAEMIDQGFTPREALEPYRTQIAGILERSPTDVDLMDRRMRRVLTNSDGDLANDAELADNIRQHFAGEWNRTDNAMQAATATTTMIAEMFGRRA